MLDINIYQTFSLFSKGPQFSHLGLCLCLLALWDSAWAGKEDGEEPVNSKSWELPSTM